MIAPLKRAAALGVTLAVLYFFVVPQLVRGGDSAGVVFGASPFLLALALGLQLASLFAYSVMTKLTLPPAPRLSMFTVVRIQLATKALAHVVPGGAAAGGALGFRLLTAAGISRPAAGFTITTAGIGSAVVLNLILWATLVVSIPLRGVRPGYLAAALVGVVLLGAVGALVWLLIRGQEWADRILRTVVRPIPFLHQDAVSDVLHQVADRLYDLAAHPRMVRRGAAWAAANWLLDAASLWMILHAFGHTLSVVDVLVAFCIAQVLGAVPVTPGGLGVIETALPVMLTGLSGIPIDAAIVGVLGWRVLQFWMPVTLGAASYASLKARREGARSSPRDGSMAG